MKGIFIIGKRCSGKGRTARILQTINKPGLTTCHLNGRGLMKSRFNTNILDREIQNISEGTELLYINEVPLRGLPFLYEILKGECIGIHNPGRYPAFIEPFVIVEMDEECSYEDLPDTEYFDENFLVYECLESLQHGVLIKLHHPKSMDEVYQSKEELS